jgi:hypothetical protein
MWQQIEPWLWAYAGLSVFAGVVASVMMFYMCHRPMDFDWYRESLTWKRYFQPNAEALHAWGQAALCLGMCTLVWPLLLFVGYRDWDKPPYERALFNFSDNDPATQFKCQREHLVRKVTPEEAEAGAMVIDPLGRAPRVPFGHLHAGWTHLLALKSPKHDLWWFEVPPPFAEKSDTAEKPRPQWSGYAITRGKSVRAEFFVEWS